MNTDSLSILSQIAHTLVHADKGILAADETSGTLGKRFVKIGVPSTDENRRAYRELLFTTAGIEKYISGVIMFDETIRQTTSEGIPFPALLSRKGIVTGIKVDKGIVPLPNSSGETITTGLEGLVERVQEYYMLGARFAKWRAVFTITDSLPTRACIEQNAEMLARYAAICQATGIVSIIEPEVLMDGAHSQRQCFEVTRTVLKTVFEALRQNCVHLEGILLKPNMILSGSTSGEILTPAQVATNTLACFREVVPHEVPGIVFLSGGQSESVATANLQACVNEAKNDPWKLTFSFGRALQDTALKTWAGNSDNVAQAQAVLLERAHLASLAELNRYTPSLEA